jgi:hypothetical protein
MKRRVLFALAGGAAATSMLALRSASAQQPAPPVMASLAAPHRFLKSSRPFSKAWPRRVSATAAI